MASLHPPPPSCSSTPPLNAPNDSNKRGPFWRLSEGVLGGKIAPFLDRDSIRSVVAVVPELSQYYCARHGTKWKRVKKKKNKRNKKCDAYANGKEECNSRKAKGTTENNREHDIHSTSIQKKFDRAIVAVSASSSVASLLKELKQEYEKQAVENTALREELASLRENTNPPPTKKSKCCHGTGEHKLGPAKNKSCHRTEKQPASAIPPPASNGCCHGHQPDKKVSTQCCNGSASSAKETFLEKKQHSERSHGDNGCCPSKAKPKKTPSGDPGCCATSSKKTHEHHGAGCSSKKSRDKETKQTVDDDNDEDYTYVLECEDCVEAAFDRYRCPGCNECCYVELCDSCQEKGCLDCANKAGRNSGRCGICNRYSCGKEECPQVFYCETCGDYCLECRPDGNAHCDECGRNLGCKKCELPDDCFLCCHCNKYFCDGCKEDYYCQGCEDFFCADCKKDYLCQGHDCCGTFCKICKPPCPRCGEKCGDCKTKYLPTSFCTVCGKDQGCEECRSKYSFQCKFCSNFFCNGCKDHRYSGHGNEIWCVSCDASYHGYTAVPQCNDCTQHY